MSADLAALLVTAILDSGTLDEATAKSLAGWVAEARPDAPAIVKQLRKRGWLTDFQIKEVSRGRGKQLVLGPYILLDLLGEGGMGRVYKARHTRLSRDVALKVIRKEKLTRPAVVQRFHQEIRAAAQLSHPNVVLAFDADQTDGIHYYAMEYVEGSDLANVVRDSGPMGVLPACDAIRQAAIGLQHAYERGMVHRDIKPSNLLLTPKGQVKVLDLGLALLNDVAGADSDARVTQPGLVLGTPDFLAPEQARNPLAVDIRADLYALGATLYYLLTGRVPYEGANPTDKLVQHVTAPPPSLLAALPDAPPQLDALIQWFMAKRPEDRPQTPAQAAHALSLFAPPMSGRMPALGAAVVPEPPPQPAYAVSAAPATEFAFAPPPAAVPTTTATPRKPAKPGGGKLPVVLMIGAAVLAIVGGVGTVAYVMLPGLIPTAQKPLPAEYTNSAGVKLVLLQPGKFVMGSNAGEPGSAPEERPAAEVTLTKPFYMGATEVTDGQFRLVMGDSPSKLAVKLRKGKTAPPVDSVTWPEAVEFCRKLTAQDKTRREGYAYRLPTEAEWEYACRAGTTTPFWGGAKLVYGKSGIFDVAADLRAGGTLGEEDLTRPKMEKGLGIPYPTASTEANPFGLFDLHGNVWEWCQDYYTPTQDGHAGSDPRGPSSGDFRSQRGGSWKEPAANCRSASRRGADPAKRQDDVGFRVVLSAE